MKPFAFLKKTPSFAKDNNLGQFNGYIAFDVSAEQFVKYDEYNFVEDSFVSMEPCCGEICEITLNGVYDIKSIGPMLPITEIPQEAADGVKFLVFGFDTCHSWNTWDEYDYKRVRGITLEWLRLSSENLREIEEMCNL